MAYPSHFLCFRLPDARNVGKHKPASGGCVLKIGHDGHVRIEGDSEEAVVAHGRLFLKQQSRWRHPVRQVEATLIHPWGRFEVILSVERKVAA